MKVQLFIPCFVNQFHPNIGINMLKLFRQLNIDPVYNPKQSCCGQIAFNSGEWDIARQMASKFIDDFSHESVIVSPSASCSAYLMNYYKKLFGEDSALYPKFQWLSDNLFELSDFLYNQCDTSVLKAKFPHKVTFHDSCSGLREYKLKDEARKLLSRVEGIQLLEMEETNECCGFGGTFAVKHKYISQAMVEQKVENAIQTGAEFITSTEASCLMNIQGYLDKNKIPLKTIHFSDILVNGID